MSKELQDVLEQLRLSFERFRRANKPWTRIPDALRQRVVAAVAQGVSMSALLGTCGLSPKQVAGWQRRSIPASVEPRYEPARVFEVADSAGAAKAVATAGAELDGALELRLGNWFITIRGTAA